MEIPADERRKASEINNLWLALTTIQICFRQPPLPDDCTSQLASHGPNSDSFKMSKEDAEQSTLLINNNNNFKTMY
jgi:hypothetical protein